MSQHFKRHLDQFSRFRRAHERDQQTDTHTQTDRPRYTPCVAIGRHRSLMLLCGQVSSAMGSEEVDPLVAMRGDYLRVNRCVSKCHLKAAVLWHSGSLSGEAFQMEGIGSSCTIIPIFAFWVFKFIPLEWTKLHRHFSLVFRLTVTSSSVGI